MATLFSVNLKGEHYETYGKRLVQENMDTGYSKSIMD